MVQATTSQVTSGSVVPQEKVKLAYKLLGEVLEEESSQPPDNAELDVLRERVKTLSSEKATLQEKIKKLSKAKKDEIEKLKKIKADSDQEVATCLQQLKTLSELRDLMQQELEKLRDATQDVAGLVEIPEGNEDEPLTLAGRLRKVPESFERYVPTTTRQYVGHVFGLVRSCWPRTPLDPLGKGAKADCTDEQFN